MNLTIPEFKEQFALYVQSMPQSQAQMALIFIANFLADYATPEKVDELPSDLSPACKALLERGCPDCEE